MTVFGAKGTRYCDAGYDYKPLVAEAATFFRTGEPPVPAEETIEIFTFMEAADESKRRGGAPVAMAEVLAKAKAEAAVKLAELKFQKGNTNLR